MGGVNVPEFVQELLASSKHGLEGIAGKLSEILAHPVIITDPLHRVKASTAEEVDPDYGEIVIHLHLEQDFEQLFFDCVLSFNGDFHEAIGHRIFFNNQNHGYIFTLLKEADGKKRLIEGYESLIKYAASLCSMQIQKEKEIKAERFQFKNAFLFDLLYGNLKKREDILAFGDIWNWDFLQPHAVLVFAIKDFNYYSSDRQLLQTLRYTVEQALIQNGIQPITFSKQNEIAVIFPKDTDSKNQQKEKEFIAFVMQQAKKTDLNERVACGIGKTYNNPEELYKSYQEAKVAYELGRLLDVDMPAFANMGLETILYKHDLQALKEFYQYVLGDLLNQDEDGELMYTLESLAKHQFDIKQTSEALFLHRNTLRYRMKKIEEILDIKLDDLNNRLNIIAAFKIKQLHNL